MLKENIIQTKLNKRQIILSRLPNTIEEAITCLKENKMINKAFGEDVIKSYIKLRSIELNDFNKTEKLDKSKPVSDWERKNTLDCQIN